MNFIAPHVEWIIPPHKRTVFGRKYQKAVTVVTVPPVVQGRVNTWSLLEASCRRDPTQCSFSRTFNPLYSAVFQCAFSSRCVASPKRSRMRSVPSKKKRRANRSLHPGCSLFLRVFILVNSWSSSWMLSKDGPRAIDMYPSPCAFFTHQKESTI